MVLAEISTANMIDREPTKPAGLWVMVQLKNIGDAVPAHRKCFLAYMGWLDQEHQTTNVAKSPRMFSDTNRNFVMVPVISAGTRQEHGPIWLC